LQHNITKVITFTILCCNSSNY